MESVSGGMLTSDDPTLVPIAYCVVVLGKTTQIWNWTANQFEPMPASGNPTKAHLRGCEPVFDTGLAAQFRCDIVPNVEPTTDPQVILMYRTNKNGEAAQYSGYAIPKQYPSTFTFEYVAKK